MKEKDLTRAPRALYREYRPANFAEVQGQGHITSVLRAAIEKDEIAHAYLFAGGRGTGKTSMARILARAVGTSDEDVYEIRSLRDGVSTLPFNSRYKFYIIDEAHALTKDAWGAFLKTLEEPPAHAVFVLATTELDRVPETIVSRCQVFQFKKPSHDILKKLVIDVAKKEGATIAPQAAELVALMGQGSFRDTLGILQKVLTVSKDQKLSEDEVAKVVGAPTSEIIRSFLEALASKNIGDALALFHKAAAGGTDAQIFLLLVLQAVRAVLLLRYAPKMEAALLEQFGEDDVAVFKKLSAREGAAINSSLLSELISAYIEMNRSPSPEIPLELALYRALGEK
jgi:DNA polymerase III subunit gamma/tau